jgi:hypothetical protein
MIIFLKINRDLLMLHWYDYKYNTNIYILAVYEWEFVIEILNSKYIKMVNEIIMSSKIFIKSKWDTYRMLFLKQKYEFIINWKLCVSSYIIINDNIC